MSSQDQVEKVLREIHLMLANSPIYNSAENKVVIDKKKMLEHLNQLNVAIYQLMDDAEISQQSRDKAERNSRKKGEEIIHQAELQAEDVYAASILYTSEALQRLQNVMQDAMDSFQEAVDKAKKGMEEEKRQVRTNQSELKGQLSDLQDTEKYVKIIDEENRKLEKKREAEKNGKVVPEPSPYAGYKPEIKLNPEYFEKIGVELDDKGNPLYDDKGEEISEEDRATLEKMDQEEEKPVAPEIRVNLDAEYFRWIEKKKGKK